MRPDQKPGFFKMLWGLLYPFLLYQGISTVISVAVGFLLMTFNFEEVFASPDPYALTLALSELISENYVLISALSAAATVPVLIVLFRADTAKEKKAGVRTEWENVPFYHYVLVTVMGAAACLTLNHLLMYSRLTELLYDGYESSAELFFSGSVIPEILVMGILVPVVEEFLFRGLAYRRMRWYLNPMPAMVLSAMYFAAVHGNWLQGIYAFVIGMLLAFAYERFHSLLAPILIHAAANTISVLISDAGLLDFIYEDDTLFLIATGVGMLVFIVTFYLMVTYVYPRKKPDAASGQPDRSNGI